MWKRRFFIFFFIGSFKMFPVLKTGCVVLPPSSWTLKWQGAAIQGDDVTGFAFCVLPSLSCRNLGSVKCFSIHTLLAKSLGCRPFDFSFPLFKSLGDNKNASTMSPLICRSSLFLPWKLIFLLFKAIKLLHQSWPFSPLRKQPVLLEGCTSVGGRALLSIHHREENHKGGSAKRNIKA